MRNVSFTTDGFTVDAELVGRVFGLPPADVLAKLRDGEVTSRCEAGVDDDAGRWRLTFYFGGRALRLVVDENGTILSRGTFPSHAPVAAPRDLETTHSKS
ncbi:MULTISPECIES: DUF6522 family protein [unclassified Thioclava]|uniref:DUF6522 family protein n=1 Tax=unclassified Thioclava TaxID=2621713 RepID=UPI000996661D|nr:MULTISPECIES: DUF6522 family protein [unclassified Thioclava]OOY08498.1 hypothetical protein BMI89_13500 [Thioclava sp. F36-7]OOY17040.1 hypothetical protein BMI85_08360 [Thioclava sp. DLFJ4-1]OOY31896.1 hypothetical protein BMI88_12665 [Thioclava sp. F36-6]